MISGHITFCYLTMRETPIAPHKASRRAPRVRNLGFLTLDDISESSHNPF